MTEIKEGNLTFSFPDRCEAGKYDDWSFYRNRFRSVAGGSKAVDVLCLADGVAWLVEIKDYRQHPRTKPSDLCDEVARKVRDTLSGLAAASASANNPAEQALACRALAMRRWRVALHLEQPNVASRLRPIAIDPASMKSKLRKGLKAIDAHPAVVDRQRLHPDMPWTVRWQPRIFSLRREG